MKVKNLMHLLRFTRKAKAIKQETLLKHSRQDSDQLSGRLYQRITELLLCNFIDCDVNGNLAGLIKEGLPTAEEIESAWLNVRSQFADAIGNNEYVLFRNTYKNIAVLEISLRAIASMVDILRVIYHPEIAKRLNNELGTKIIFDPTDPLKYQKTLDGCVTRSKSIKIKIDLLEIQQQGLNERHQEGGRTTLEYYQSILITLSDHAKYPITDKITVFEFCDRIKRFNKFCEQQKQQISTLKRGGRV